LSVLFHDYVPLLNIFAFWVPTSPYHQFLLTP
jgi:hypothetical protein